MIKNILILIGAILIVSCRQPVSNPLSVEWIIDTNVQSSGYYTNVITIFNAAEKKLDNNWIIYFNQFPHHLEMPEKSPVSIEHINGTYFKLYPTQYYVPVEKDDTLTIICRSKNKYAGKSFLPDGAYIVFTENGKESTPKSLHLNVKGCNEIMNDSYTDIIYEEFEKLNNPVKLKYTDIIPSIKKVEEVKQQPPFIFTQDINIIDETGYINEANILRQSLTNQFGCKISNTAKTKIIIEKTKNDEKVYNKEHYFLIVADDHISIKGENSHAIFNGVQTLLALLSNKSLPAELDQIKISDYPDFEYRGLMVDVARNFTKKDDMLKLIDILAMYKMNVLHLHLTDDEGWRIQIPDIEELTEVGARRGHSKDEAHFLFPAYGSGWDPQNTLSLGNGYYTKQDYIEILRYANARHISIVPEIDLPGHARAAIVAMKARYNKYKDSDPLKAKEYLLSEHADTSKYKSVQSYSDNVINIALPSSYRFIEKVITELAKMHNEAGIELDMIHIGGDEVPKGAWEGSPECKKLMQMLDITDPGSLKDYFVNEVLKITEPQNIRVAGWQEIALKAHKEVVSEKFTNKNILSYCWNTMPGWEADEVPYKLANAGYQVILCNVSNFYFDLAYSPDFLEPGHNWGGYNDEISSFDMQPYNIYQSIRRTTKGLPLNNPIEYTNKELLRKESQKQILGLQGQLFTETIRNFDMVTYYLLPKMLGLAERAWNAEPNWIRTQLGDDYNDAVDLYNTIIAEKEFPKFHRLGYNFRVSRPGLKIIDGMLHANSKIPQSQIRFTTDGSEPDLQSQEWTKPIPCISHIVKAKVFYYGKESNTTIWKNKHINN